MGGMLFLVAVGLSVMSSGCFTFARYGTYHWKAYAVRDGFLVDCWIHGDFGSPVGDEKWKRDLCDAVKQVVVTGLRKHGISIENSAVLSFSGARGWSVISVVAGSGTFVKHAVEMDGGFFQSFSPKTYDRIVYSGRGVIPP